MKKVHQNKMLVNEIFYELKNFKQPRTDPVVDYLRHGRHRRTGRIQLCWEAAQVLAAETSLCRPAWC